MADKQLHYKSLRRILSVGFFLCGVTPIIIIAAASIYDARQIATKDLELTASQVVQHRQDVIKNFLDHQINLLDMLIKLYPPEFFRNQENMNRLFLAIGTSDDVVDLQSIDTMGKQLAYVGAYRTAVADKTWSDQTWFTQTLARGAYVSDVFSGYRNAPHFVVAVTDPLKRIILRSTINYQVFNSLLHSAQIGSHGHVFIVNAKGEIQTSEIQNRQMLPAEEQSLIRRHSGPELTQVGDRLYATIWINDNWLLINKIEMADVLGPYEKHLARTLWVAVITTIIFLIIGVFLSRFIIGRITRADREAAAFDQQMAQIEKMANIGRLAAGVAHEINNPLQMILAQAGWMEELLAEEQGETSKNLDEYRGAMKKIRYHVDRAAAITQRLLGFSRKISGDQSEVRVNDLVRETVSFLEKEAKTHNITVNLRLADDLPLIFIEGNRLQQVILNLVDNALDATGQNGQVDVVTECLTDAIALRVEDNGSGIPPEVIKQIWDPFFTTKEKGKGTGLGLSISQSIIRNLGGTIDVAPRNGGGTVFTITLPFRPQQQLF
jgi:two-component system NtrC family sensor kinase